MNTLKNWKLMVKPTFIADTNLKMDRNVLISNNQAWANYRDCVSFEGKARVKASKQISSNYFII
jgi:hypothetical protein